MSSVFEPVHDYEDGARHPSDDGLKSLSMSC